MSYAEEDTCMSYEEEDACMSYEEEDTCMSRDTQDGHQTLVKLVIKVRERAGDLLVQARDLAHLHLIGH